MKVYNATEEFNSEMLNTNATRVIAVNATMVVFVQIREMRSDPLLLRMNNAHNLKANYYDLSSTRHNSRVKIFA